MAGTGVGKFSSTAGNNTGNMTVNFAENMAPSNVNNAARELMGHIYDMYKQIGDGYFEFGDGDATYTVARSDADTITITSSSDISSIYFPGRKIRITDGGANVVEGTIASSSHSSTTQTVNLTGISLASGTPTKVELGIDTAAFGGRIILDDDGDTYIEAVTDDTIDFYAGSTKIGTFTATTVTFNDGVEITTADNTDTLTLTSTDADASSGPNLRMYRNSSSPADSDILGVLEYEGRNDNSEDVRYVQMTSFADDVSDGTEDGSLFISTSVAGTLRNRINVRPTEVVVNEESIDSDFRVESNALTHAFFLDGGTDHISIGNSSTSLYTLDIKQNADFTGSNSDTANEAPLRVTSTHSNGRGAIAVGGNNNNGIFNKGTSDIVVQGYNGITFDCSTTNDDKFGTKTERFRINGAGNLATGAETDPDVSAGGITLQQNALDTNILSFKSSDVAHGITGVQETDTYGFMKKKGAAQGGLVIGGLVESGFIAGVEINATVTEVDQNEAAGAEGAVQTQSMLKSGTGNTGMGADDNIFVCRNNTAQFIVKGDGELFSNQSATVGTFDEYEDAQLVRAYDLNHMQGVINSKFDKFVQYNKDDLQKAKLIGSDKKGNATPFVNITGMSRLHNGAIWQQYEKHQKLVSAFYKLAEKTIGKEEADKLLTDEEIQLLN